MKKIVVYSHDTFGLGNIRRMLVIIQHILDQYGDISILLISGSPVLHLLKLPRERFDYIKLPCLARHQNGEYGVKLLNTGFKELVNLRSQAIKSALNIFQPEVVLVDKKPAGVADELLPAIQDSIKNYRKARWVLLLRDILDNPVTTKSIWKAHDYHAIIEKSYHSVLVVGCKDIFDIRQEYDFPPAVADKVVFCGYTKRANLNGTAGHSLTRLFLDKKLVLVTPGGGEDGFQLIKTYLQGLETESNLGNLRSLIVTGPEMPVDEQDQIKEMASDLKDVDFKTFIPDLLSLMQRADLVVSMAGYNTLCEILSLNKSAIVVPRATPVEEQWIRAERFALNGWLTCIHPNNLTPTVLLKAVNTLLKNPESVPVATKAIDFDGLPNVSRFIRKALDNVTPSSEIRLDDRTRKSPQRDNTSCRSPVGGETPGSIGRKKNPGFVDTKKSSDQSLPLLLPSKV